MKLEQIRWLGVSQIAVLQGRKKKYRKYTGTYVLKLEQRQMARSQPNSCPTTEKEKMKEIYRYVLS